MILVMAGTSDGKSLARSLQQMGYPVMVTVTTGYGKTLAQDEGLNVVTGALDKTGIIKLINDCKADWVLDATHPYAVQASVNAMGASEETGVPYIRYERPRSSIQTSGVETYATVEALCQAVENEPGNILLTIGSNHIHHFGNLRNSERIYVRILPVPAQVSKAADAGFRPNRILAMQGPFSEAFNSALIRQWDISALVTKDSASAGGFQDKISAAEKVGIKVLIWGRPDLNYGTVCETEEDVIAIISRKNP